MSPEEAVMVIGYQDHTTKER